MLNKKLVIAALLAVSTNVMPEVSATAKTDDTKKADDTKKTEVKKDDTKKDDTKKTDDTKKADDTKKTETKKDDTKKVEPKKLPEDPTLRPAWQKGTGAVTQDSLNAKGTYTLCDQGNTAMWKAAEEKYTKLAKAETDAKSALDAAKKEYDALDKLVTAATEAQSKHTKENATFLANAKKSIADHSALLNIGTAVYLDGKKKDTAAKLLAYKEAADGKVSGALKVTQDAEAEVTKQRTRLESLLALKVKNVAEENAWATRITALQTASVAADAVVVTDTTAVEDLKAIGMSRSYLFRTLQIFSSTEYDGECDALKYCLYNETARTASSSTWKWMNAEKTCTTDQKNKAAKAIKCTILGLKGKDAGLTQSALAFLGKAGTPGKGDGTGAYKTLDAADYTVKQGAAAKSRLKEATDMYAAWQALSMYGYAMQTACWKTAGTTAKTSKYQAADWYSLCGAVKTDAKENKACKTALQSVPETGCMQFNPLINSIAKSKTVKAVTDGQKFTQEDIRTEATGKKDTWGQGKANDKNLTTFWDTAAAGGAAKVNLVEVRAKAQIQLWLKNWSNQQIVNVNKTNVDTNGDWNAKPAAGAKQADIDAWAKTGIGKAETTLTNDTSKKTKAKSDWDFAVAQQASQGKDDAALALDITNAQALLGDLVKDVAAKARLEGASKAAWELAVKAEATAQADRDRLGTDKSKDGKTPATMDYAVNAAAIDVRDKIEAQDKFHAARVLWATENRAPALLKWTNAQQALNGVPLMNVSGKDKGSQVFINGIGQTTGGAVALAAAAKASMVAAKEACKVAAFSIATKAFEADAQLTKDKAAARKIMVEKYTALSKFPTDGSRGTLCNLPKGNPDGDRVKECKEEEGGQALCCGAAQRFLKNGTKLTIETCQLAIAGTYTYYPPLEDNDVEQPIPETWRFQCISGAQKLAAVAAAVLAAGAMIA